MKKIWDDKIRKITPYTPGEQPGTGNIIKLNTNECPYAPSENVKKVLEMYNTDNLRLYPSFSCLKLKEKLSDIYKLSPESFFVGNGSDEVIALCFMTFFNSEKPVLFPDITYSFYDVWCDLFNIKFKRIPLDDGFGIVREDYFQDNGGIVIANPNAPTSIYIPLNDIEEILINNPGSIVIIDEAYIDFGAESAMNLVKKYDNLVVVQTFSKSRALAGIRVGYAAAGKALIDYLDAVKNSFNSYTLGGVAQELAIAALEDKIYFEQCTRKIIDTRERTIIKLNELGFKTLQSKANFIFTTNPDISAMELYEFLKKNNILVRYFNKPRISGYLRITIGTDDEMERLIQMILKFQRRQIKETMQTD